MLFPPVIRQVEDRYDYVVARQDTPTDTGTPTPTDTPTTPTSTPTTPTSTPTDPGSTPPTPPTTPPTPPTTSSPPQSPRPPTRPTPPPGSPPPDRPPSSTVSRVITQSVSGGGYTTIVTSVVIITGTDGATTTVDGGSGGGGSGGSNNIGVIVGASVGGAVAVALIGLIWFILARKARERRHKKYENDIFNPDHTVRGPNFDLGSGPDPEMLPDPYTVPAHHHGQGGPPPMQQYHAYDPYAPVTAGYTAGPTHPMSPYGSAGHHYDASSATSGGETGHGLAGIGAAAMAGGAAGTEYEANRLSGTPSGETPSTGTGTGSGGNGSAAPLTSRLAKEREAFARSNARFSAAQGNLAPGMVSPTPTGTSLAYVSHGRTTSSQYSTDSAIPNSPIRSDNGQPFRTGLGLANPDGSVRAVSPTGTDPGRAISPTGVVVHQDAGRVPDHDDSPEEHEIPPTYDSIAAAPADGRPMSGEARPLSSA